MLMADGSCTKTTIPRSQRYGRHLYGIAAAAAVFSALTAAYRPLGCLGDRLRPSAVSLYFAPEILCPRLNGLCRLTFSLHEMQPIASFARHRCASVRPHSASVAFAVLCRTKL